MPSKQSMKKFPMYVAILASIALAENLQAQNTNNTHINTQQATLTPDQFYEKIQKTRQNYDYLPVFKKVWNQKRNSVLREPAYKGVIENVIANNEQTYWRDDLDIIILVL